MNDQAVNYCLGYTHEKCDNCKNLAYWHELNQLPDALRKSLQAQATRVNSDQCRMTKMSLFIQK